MTALARVFVANRGEIAVRIVGACRAVVLGPAPARDSYLDANLLVHAAKATGCDALHPGYGFLSESPILAGLCEREGIAFIGPTAETIERLGDKLSARTIAAEAGVPIVPGSGRIARHLDYRNAGTVESLYDVAHGAAYFIEANVRIQVEHPVTEEVAGIDLIEEQLRIAGGDGLSVAQEDIAIAGHAIECRINAEAPARDFAPSPGLIDAWHPPAGAGIRIDSHCRAGFRVSPFYDGMIAKLIVRAADRAEAVERMGRALEDFEIGGIETNLAFQARLVRHPDFVANRLNTRWLEDVFLPAPAH